MSADLDQRRAVAPGGPTPPRRPRTLGGYLMLGVALVTCPCHLPLLLIALAGTGLGAYLSDHVALTGIALTGAFIASLVLGLRWVGSSGQAEEP